MKNEPVPRYVVRLPEGDVELEALEIFKRIQSHKADFQTSIRPVEGGDWRKIGEEPAFATALPFLYTQGRCFWWLPWFSLLVLAFPFLLIVLNRGLLGGWPYFCLSNSGMWAIWLLAYIKSLELFLLKHGLYGWRSARMLIPWWNSVEGYCLFQECAEELPPRSARFLRRLNPFVWVSLAMFYSSFFLASPDTVGGRLILLCYGIFWLFLCLSSIPISYELKRRDNLFRSSNPKPPKNKEKSPLWNRFRNREIIRYGLPDALRILLCLAVAALVFLIPWRIIGEIRWNQAVKYELPAMQKPYAAPELMKIALPKFPVSAHGTLKGVGGIPADLRAELKKVEPQLDAVREILRKYPALGLRRDIEGGKNQPIDLCNEKLRDYLCWRRLGLRAGGNFRELLRDLERRTGYAAEEPVYGIYHLELNTRMGIVSTNLRQFSDEELEREKALWRKLATLADSAIAGSVLEQNAQTTEYLIHSLRLPSGRFLLFFFADGLRATFLDYSRELTDILSRDAWQTRNAFLKFQTRMDRLGGLHWMWAISNQMGLKKSEEKDRDLSPDYSLLNTASRFRAVCRLAEAGIGLEQVRRQHGNYPEKADLPTDPFDGKPLRYLPGVAIYSVGSDLKDDGGKQESGATGSSPDIVFSLEGEN